MGNHRGAASLVGSAVIGALFWLRPAPALAAPEIAILGAGADGFKFRVSESHFEHRFHVVAKNAEPIGAVTPLGAPFEDAAGVPVETAWSWGMGPPAPVRLTSAAELLVVADLPHAGDYTAELVLVHADTRTVARISLTYVLAPAEAGLEAVGSTTKTTLSWPFEGSTELRVTLRDTGDTARRLERPVLANLDLKGPGNDSFQTPARLREVRAAGRAIRGGFDLTRGGVLPFDLTFDGLDVAGRYQGSVRFASSGRKPLDVPIAVLVKRPAWLAFIFILIGVLASAVLRWYLTKGRNNLVWRRDLLELRNRLAPLAEQPRGAEERQVLERCRRDLATLLARVDDARPVLAKESDPSSAIETLSKRLDAFALLLRVARQVAGLPAVARATPRASLDNAAADLAAADTDAAISDVVKALNALKVTEAYRTALAQALTQTEELLRASVTLLPEAEQRELDTLWGELHATERALTTANLARAREILATARSKVVTIQSRGLLAELEAGAPLAVGPTLWQELRGRLVPELEAIGERAKSDPEAAAESFSGLLSRYADQLIVALKATSEDVVTRVRASAVLAPEDKQELERRAGVIKSELEAVRSAKLGERFDAVRRNQPKLGELWMLSSAEPEAKKVANVAEPVIELVRAWASPVTLEDARVSGAEDLPRVRRALATSDRVVTVALLVVAVLSGLDVLWMNDPVWGGLGAYLIATLWGLGLHSVGNVTFDGLVGLRDRFSKAS